MDVCVVVVDGIDMIFYIVVIIELMGGVLVIDEYC